MSSATCKWLQVFVCVCDSYALYPSPCHEGTVLASGCQKLPKSALAHASRISECQRFVGLSRAWECLGPFGALTPKWCRLRVGHPGTCANCVAWFCTWMTIHQRVVSESPKGEDVHGCPMFINVFINVSICFLFSNMSSKDVQRMSLMFSTEFQDILLHLTTRSSCASDSLCGACKITSTIKDIRTGRKVLQIFGIDLLYA